MKRLLIVCALAALACGRAGAMADDDIIATVSSTDAAKGDYPPEDEETLGVIQESDEDLAAFVQDYISKDSALKGAFFIEERGSGKVLKLSLDTLLRKTSEGPDNSRIVEGVFKAAGGKKCSVLFYIQSAGFGGLDIFKVELKKKEEKPQKK